MLRVAIVIYNTHYTVKVYDMSIHDIIKKLCDELTTYRYDIVMQQGYSKFKKKPYYVKVKDNEFFYFNKKTNQYNFPINTNRNFLLLLGNFGVRRDEISLTLNKSYAAETIELKIREVFIPRPYQHKYMKALTDNNSKNIMLIDLRTGHGKTLIFLLAAIKLRRRIGILIKPAYIDKTILDLKRYLYIEDDEIYVIQGSASLIDLMQHPNPQYKVIIFSMRTMQNYIDNYVTGDFNYPVDPTDVFRQLKIGTLFNDETHQEFHALFMILLHCDVNTVIGSTATFESSDPYMNKMYEYLFPLTHRVSNLVEYEKYTHIYAIQYETNSMRGIQFKRARGYSQTLYEQSILRNNLLLRDYLNMISYYVTEGYYKRKVKGDKMLIFASSINMCTIITNHLSQKFKDLDVRRYVEDDSYDNLMQAEITVSTQGSAGTAVDIPNLITVLQTVSMSSMQANEQNAGRLRNLPGKEMRYYYVFCKGIKQHFQHHLDRKQAIAKIALTYVKDDYPFKLRVK